MLQSAGVLLTPASAGPRQPSRLASSPSGYAATFEEAKAQFRARTLEEVVGRRTRPCGISELAVNSALAIIEAVAPKDEVEGALALQMACTHMAAMAILARFEGGFSTERRTALFGSAAARLLRTYVAQVEALRGLRQGGLNSSASSMCM